MTAKEAYKLAKQVRNKELDDKVSETIERLEFCINANATDGGYCLTNFLVGGEVLEAVKTYLKTNGYEYYVTPGWNDVDLFIYWNNPK